MEHLTTFGLTRDPFANDSQLAFWFESPGAVDAARRLARAVSQAKGLCLLTGEGGVGKTLLVRHFFESLEEEVVEAALLVPIPGVSDGRWILDRFARHLGVEEPAAEPAALLGQIYEQLAIVREDGRHAVLIIDEAQVLVEEGVLRNLRGLLNLEYEDRRLLTVVLAGLPALARAVGEEPALAERVDLRLRLPALDEEAAGNYLAHRIRSVGGDPAILDSGAVDALVKHAGGSPRRLNNLADAALFEAHLAGRGRASAADVERAVAELGLATPAEGPAPPPAPGPRSEAPAAAASEASAAAATPAPGSASAPATPAQTDPEPEAAPLEPADDLELEEVVADETDPLRGALASDSADVTMTFADDPLTAEPATPAPEAGPDFGNTDGELDDLFAEIVED